jgi:xylulokinase
MESIGLVLRQNIAEMQMLGLNCKEIRSLGGGAKSRLWNQIKADILGRPLTTMRCPEAASLGMAVLQAKATGIYPSIQDAAENMVHTASVVEPSQNNTRTYEPVFTRFLELNKKCF